MINTFRRFNLFCLSAGGEIDIALHGLVLLRHILEGKKVGEVGEG